MKPYVKLPIEATELLSPKDIYTFTGLYFHANEEYTTDTTYQQLSDLTGCSTGYVKRHFMPRLAQSGLVKETTGWRQADTKRRKRYHFAEPRNMFKMVRKGIFEDSRLKPQEKGFLIALYCNSVNGTFNLGLRPSELLKKIKVSKGAFYNYRNALIEKGYLSKHEDIPNNPYSGDHPEDYMITCDWLGRECYRDWLREQRRKYVDE